MNVCKCAINGKVNDNAENLLKLHMILDVFAYISKRSEDLVINYDTSG